ncbi:hypothetical protein FNV43_RR24490 [Rhamnella rubrinervis]|uniref:Uncharacterized protein n=1 Tax=Rhamnella rubrinervis TaxID=2594499 RepID=A0A8K0DQM0_9ROSA|nr:hypothetical protein FNV43_RR24490 [Rhamnella rubrinervis]
MVYKWPVGFKSLNEAIETSFDRIFSVRKSALLLGFIRFSLSRLGKSTSDYAPSTASPRDVLSYHFGRRFGSSGSPKVRFGSTTGGMPIIELLRNSEIYHPHTLVSDPLIRWQSNLPKFMQPFPEVSRIEKVAILMDSRMREFGPIRRRCRRYLSSPFYAASGWLDMFGRLSFLRLADLRQGFQAVFLPTTLD